MVYRTTPKMAERKLARRQKLLKVAVAIFGKRGYHQTTVPMIVAKSGSSIGSFYMYFRNKENIFAAVIEAIGEQISASLNEAIAKAPPGLPQMKAAVIQLFLFLTEHPNEARILIVESSGLGPVLEEARRKVVESHARSVEKALVASGLALVNPAIAARCWLGAVYESGYHWLELTAAERPPAAEVAQTVASFVLRGVGAPEDLL